jgi:hypothetical protein
VLDVTRAQELRRIEDYEHHVAIGAAVSLTDAFAALVAERPRLKVFANRFAGLPVRNAGTLGGNIANGSPIGDSMPLLIALDAQLVLMKQGGHRHVPLEAFYTGYRKTVLAPDELVAWILVPRRARASSCAPTRCPSASTTTSPPSAWSSGWSWTTTAWPASASAPAVSRPRRFAPRNRGLPGRQALDASHGARGHRRAEAGVPAHLRHARLGRVPAHGAGQPAAAVLAGDAGARTHQPGTDPCHPGLGPGSSDGAEFTTGLDCGSSPQ